MSNQQTYEKIEAYLNNELSGNDLFDFEAQLKSNPDLVKQVSLFKEMNIALSGKPTLDFQRMVQSEVTSYVKEEGKKGKVKKMGWSWQSLSVAASLIILIGAFLIWKTQLESPVNGPELFAEYFEIYDLNQGLRGQDSAENAIYKLGVLQYQAGDYVAAEKTFESLTRKDNDDMEFVFCLALSYLNQQAPKRIAARQQFEKIIKEGNSIYVSSAKWYSSLLLLDFGEMDRAKELLEEVAQQSDGHGRKAREILQKL